MFYFKLTLMGIWLFMGCCISILVSPFFRKNPKHFGIGMRIITWGMLKITGVTVKPENSEILERAQPCVYLGNHQSAFDAVTYGVVMPTKTTAVAKSDVKKVPILGWWYWAIGGSFIQRTKRHTAVQELKNLGDQIRSGKLSVAMMPEGTRNRAGTGLLPFKKGPFHLAVYAQVPLVPVLSSPLEKIANFDSRTLNPGTVIIRTLDPIPTKGLTENDVDALMERTRIIMLEGLKNLGHKV